MASPTSRSRDNSSKRLPYGVRVLVADESRISCQSLKDSLERVSRKVRVVAHAVNRKELTESLVSGIVDVALIHDDFREGYEEQENVLRSIHREFPAIKLIAILKRSDAASVVGAFRGGVRGVFHRSQTVESLSKCVRAVHEGQVWANSQDLQHVIGVLDLQPPDGTLDPPEIALLTKRENDAARLVAEGNTNRAIAEKLGLTEHTVSNYLFRIYNKLGISSRVELVLYSFSQKREP
jgi:DNA-binding NarL/FixJ family response regulator